MCRRLRGYQFGATDAFIYSAQGIDSYYVEGVSLTHGGAGRRQHIWTFAAGLSEGTPAIISLITAVLVIQETMTVSPHLLEMISFVRAALTQTGIFRLYSLLMMSSEMVKTVIPPAQQSSMVYKDPTHCNN